MYVILVYDVDERRVQKVCKFLRRYLNWVQNSVFEGELTEARLEAIRNGLLKRIDPGQDSVFIYTTRSQRVVRKQVLGVEAMPTDNLVG